jgi:hypothetical protein
MGMISSAMSFNHIDPSPLLCQEEIDPRFQGRVLRKFKIDLLEKISALKLSENSRSYYLHQVSQVHDIDPLLIIVQEINQRLEA